MNTDSTILNVALPPLVRELHATSSELQWIVDGVAERWARVGDRSPGRRSVALGVLMGGRCSVSTSPSSPSARWPLGVLPQILSSSTWGSRPRPAPLVLGGAGEALQTVLNERVHRFRGEVTVRLALAGRGGGQQLDALIDVLGAPNVKAPLAYASHYLSGEHQVANVGLGDHHPLVTGELLQLAGSVEAFDLRVRAADRL